MKIYEQLDQFSDYIFNETTHTYWLNGIKVEESVTGIVGRYTKPFDKDYWAQKKANDRGVDKQVVLNEWDEKAEFSATCGTQFHTYMENLIAGKQFDPHIEGRDEVNERLDLLMPLGDAFISDSKHKLIPIRSEFIVGKDTEVAGLVDQLFYNSTFGTFEVWDWKTNKSIDETNFYRQFMLTPFGHLFDCNFYHYSLQLNIYKYLMKLKGIDISNCYFVWFNEKNDSYKIYECADLQQTVSQII